MVMLLPSVVVLVTPGRSLVTVDGSVTVGVALGSGVVGRGVAGDQFAAFAKWYADNKAAGRTVGEITPVIDDYGDAKAGAATATEVKFETKQGDRTYGQCLVFAWIEASPRKNPQAFTCDDVAAVEKWKTDQALKSAWR